MIAKHRVKIRIPRNTQCPRMDRGEAFRPAVDHRLRLRIWPEFHRALGPVRLRRRNHICGRYQMIDNCNPPSSNLTVIDGFSQARLPLAMPRINACKNRVSNLSRLAIRSDMTCCCT